MSGINFSPTDIGPPQGVGSTASVASEINPSGPVKPDSPGPGGTKDGQTILEALNASDVPDKLS